VSSGPALPHRDSGGAAKPERSCTALRDSTVIWGDDAAANFYCGLTLRLNITGRVSKDTSTASRLFGLSAACRQKERSPGYCRGFPEGFVLGAQTFPRDWRTITNGYYLGMNRECKKPDVRRSVRDQKEAPARGSPGLEQGDGSVACRWRISLLTMTVVREREGVPQESI
jgi:hypothetical protein